jgi:hypothetical protein
MGENTEDEKAWLAAKRAESANRKTYRRPRSNGAVLMSHGVRLLAISALFLVMLAGIGWVATYLWGLVTG